MKYTIELTNAEKEVICNIITAIRNNSLGGQRLFDNTTLFKFDEESTDYDVVYRKGVADGNNIADKDLKEIQDSTYDVAYNKALEDIGELMAYITQEFIDNCYPNDKGYNLYDLNAKYGLARVLKDYKAYEEKKKVEEEFIKVGDEVVCNCPNEQKVIITAKCNGWVTFMRKDGACYSRADKDMKKTGRHFEEITQLLHKLRDEGEQ